MTETMTDAERVAAAGGHPVGDCEDCGRSHMPWSLHFNPDGSARHDAADDGPDVPVPAALLFCLLQRAEYIYYHGASGMDFDHEDSAGIVRETRGLLYEHAAEWQRRTEERNRPQSSEPPPF